MPPLNPPGVQPPIPPAALPIPPIVVPPQPQAQLPTGLVSFGTTLPPRQPPQLSPHDARTWAIMALLDYLSTIPFVRLGAVGQPLRAMPILRSNMYVRTPGDGVDLLLPSVVCLTGPSKMEPIGFAPQPEESSLHVYGWNTVVVPQYSFIETVPIEVWGARLEEVRSVLSGFEASLMPTDGTRSLRLTLPLYYGQVARYTLESTEWSQDDENAAKQRRHALAHVTVEVDSVTLYNAVTMRPIVVIDTEPGNISPLATFPKKSYGNLPR